MAPIARDCSLLDCAARSPQIVSRPRRRTGREEGRALETLGHAIQYLCDGCAGAESARAAEAGRLDAIRTLAGLNREIYLACPERGRWRDCIKGLFHTPEIDAPEEPWDWPSQTGGGGSSSTH